MSNQSSNQGLVLSADAKPRLKWTKQLHDRFVDAVNQLGGADKATPKSVMQVMGIHELTLYHLKSHLQKYRLAKSQDANILHGYREGEIQYKILEKSTPDAYENKAPNQLDETMLQMQIQVQRKLQEQIEDGRCRRRRGIQAPSSRRPRRGHVRAPHPRRLRGRRKAVERRAAAGIEPGVDAHDAMILAMLKSNRFEDAVAMLKSMRARRPRDVGLDS